MTNETMTIDRLVEESEATTLVVRKKHGVLPEEVSETFARHAAELRKAWGSFGKFQEKERFGKYLNVLANFPILKTELLLLSQEVVLRVNDSKHNPRPTARLPLFGVIKLDRREPSPFSAVIQTRNDGSIVIKLNYQIIEFRELGGYLRMLRGGLGTLAGELSLDEFDGRVTQSVPNIPKKISESAMEAKDFGFASLGLVWGPAEYTLEEIPYKSDPLLVGKMFDTWWILAQWDVTDAEKKLIPTKDD